MQTQSIPTANELTFDRFGTKLSEALRARGWEINGVRKYALHIGHELGDHIEAVLSIERGEDRRVFGLFTPGMPVPETEDAHISEALDRLDA